MGDGKVEVELSLSKNRQFYEGINYAENLREVQRDQVFDDYSRGLYNGLELAMAAIYERDPVLIKKGR